MATQVFSLVALILILVGAIGTMDKWNKIVTSRPVDWGKQLSTYAPMILRLLVTNMATKFFTDVVFADMFVQIVDTDKKVSKQQIAESMTKDEEDEYSVCVLPPLKDVEDPHLK